MTLLLKNNPNIVFTTEGHQNGGSNQLQYATSTQSHDGYPGATTVDLISKSTMPSSADITLVHAGTNDIFWRVVLLRNCGWSVNPIADSLFVSLKNLMTANSKTKVYVAKIVKFSQGSMVLPSVVDSINIKVDQYNKQIEKKWKDLPQEWQKRISIVDMSSVLNSSSDYINDGVHPSREGYLKMACAWIRAINGMPLNPGDQCSCLTTNAVIQLMPQQN
jgi:lysophospholipase L1-like esterase